MEGGPPGSPSRRGAQTAAVSCRSRAGVGSDCGEGPPPAGQVSDGKTNMCEPLLTHRNAKSRRQNRGRTVTPGQRRALRDAPSARRRPACRPGGARCKGGVSPSQALARNRRTCRPDVVGQSKWAKSAPWSQEGGPQAVGHRKRQSTDAGHRDGPARSSDEGPVMGLERRGRADQGQPEVNPAGEEPKGC